MNNGLTRVERNWAGNPELEKKWITVASESPRLQAQKQERKF